MTATKENRHARPWLPLLLVIVASAAMCLSAHGQGRGPDATGYRLIELAADTLPHLNNSRTGHATLCLDGELTVLGGHTDGFVPIATAEYLRDGKWHTVPLVYPHDHGTIIQLRSGKVFLAGGHKEPLGIEQTYSAELYDPAIHSSQGFGCLDRKRTFANAAEMADGQVVIAGNWYADDAIEMFTDVYDPIITNAIGVKGASMARTRPYILRVSDDDAIIFSSLDNRADTANCSIVDRLKGPAYHEPFLDTWHPIQTSTVQRSTNQFIGDEAQGRYEWLLPVEHAVTGQIAIAHVQGPKDGGDKATFTLLPTPCPLPDSIQGKHIIYSSLICDRKRQMAYLIGDNDEARIYVVAIPYGSADTAPMTIYMTAPQQIMAQALSPVLTAEGDLVFAGGHLHSNFSPTGTVIRLRIGGDQGAGTADASTCAAEPGARTWWLWILLPCIAATLIAAVIMVRRKKAQCDKAPANQAPTIAPAENAQIDKIPTKEDILADIFKRIEVLMKEERLYIDANLRASDVANRIGSNTAYVSAAINSQCGCSFSQYLNSYRIAYAQRLMREDPERKISDISALSGFSTDSTFFRAFRASTGMSPKEWLASIRDQQGQ